MSLPLYRVQGLGGATRGSMAYLRAVQNVRSAFDTRERPAKAWECGTELFNITHPGCKVTAFCYTMTLTDYHKLFIGRMGEAGNEVM